MPNELFSYPVSVVDMNVPAPALSFGDWTPYIIPKYQLVMADCPWSFKVRSPKGEGRSALHHYGTMSLEDIKALPVKHVVAKDSVLLLWAIDPMLPHAMEVIEAWGFEYKTVGFYWVKTNRVKDGFFTGLGYYTRANPEICLLATRGKGLPRKDKSVRRLIVAPRGKHSEKPQEAFLRAERLFGPVSRLELFARTPRNGWTCLGNEIDGMDIFDSLEMLTDE